MPCSDTACFDAQPFEDAPTLSLPTCSPALIRVKRDGDASIVVAQSLTSETEQRISSANASTPAFAPNGQLVSYTQTEPVRAGVYDLAAESEFFVSEEAEKGRDPSWAPDSMKLAYVSGVSLRDDVVIYDLADETRVAIEASPMEDFERPQVSPDGLRLVLINDRNDDISGDAIVRTISSGEQSTIDGEPLSGIRSCSWSPAGDRLACATGEGVVVMDSDGTNQIPIVGSVSSVQDVRWAPGGEQLAFDDNSPTPRLFIAAADGSDIRDFGIGAFATWSPDGTMLAYTRFANNRPTDVDLFDFESNISVMLLPDAGRDYASWSPCE